MAGAVFEPPEPADARRRRGKGLRAAVRREALGEWSPPADRPDPTGILDRQNATRVPELVPLRYQRMLASPFSFLRGSAAIMAWDLAHGPRTDLMVMACGDAHLANFGLFAGPDRRLVFDLNDFDEVHRGPFEWDVKRLAASVFVASVEDGHEPREARAAARVVGQAYRETMARAAGMTSLDIWYARIEADALRELVREMVGARPVAATEAVFAKAERRTPLDNLARFATVTSEGLRIKEDPPLVVRLPHDRHAEATKLLFDAYANYLDTLASDRRQLVARYRFQDIARKVVGVGSVGTMCFIVLFVGDTTQDPLFLQIKEAQESVLAPYVEGVEYRDQGQRVVEGQRLIQSASDPFLGWFTGTGPLGRDFYVRQLRDKKGGFDISVMRPEGMRVYARVCASALARAHARTGDPIAIDGYLGSGAAFDAAIERFAVRYGKQNRRDYRRVRAARG
ncbi:DUF2252 domain-containing protein [Rhodococcus tukisamuensis]|uniref:DUF2252 domain-containing protein n=1 Tax=Rhodococcus tukisamuensis TaxID=168276 RepID=A0A1G6SEX7_9NOCA|nr:DUF2252 domain-containing protein [Rhodococcus tukisamuensis]SDD15429.1 hypothetical protein SAMN05444580_103117 [Rhodococcus tukisamuensis]